MAEARTTKLRCKPGDLAIVSRCRNPAHIGLIVRIVSSHENGDFDWNVKLIGSPIKGRAIYSGRIATFRRAAAFDWNLTPLPGQEHSNQGEHLREVPENHQMS